MAAELTISSLVAGAVIREAARAGLEEAPLFDLVGLGAARAATADMHIEIESYYRLWERIIGALGDPAFAIRAGAAFRLEDNELFGFLAMSCETLGQTFERTSKYRHLYNRGARWELQPEGRHMRLIWYPWPGDVERPGTRAAVEFAMADMWSAGRQLSRAAINPVEVRIAHSAPQEAEAHRRLFGVAPVFGALLHEIVFDAPLLTLPVASFNSPLRDYFDKQCALLLTRQAGEESMAARVRKELVNRMDGGDLSMAAVARALAMSARSLQRRLAGEDTGFDDLLDEVRQEFAKRYLARGLAASEIGYLVGFRSPTAFFRAFKRWTGETPRAFRRLPPARPARPRR